jgi:hypothetical protein
MPTNNRHEWSIEYRESAALTTIDGFLVAHHGQCHITTRSDLELPTKSAEIRRLLAFLTTIHNDSPDVYLYASPPRSTSRKRCASLAPEIHCSRVSNLPTALSTKAPLHEHVGRTKLF